MYMLEINTLNIPQWKPVQGAEGARGWVDVIEGRVSHGAQETPATPRAGVMSSALQKKTFTAASTNSEAELRSQSPSNTTLCIYKEPLPDQCFPTICTVPIDWKLDEPGCEISTKCQVPGGAEPVVQAFSSDALEMRLGDIMNVTDPKRLAKGSVGLMQIQKPQPKRKTKSVMIGKTTKKTEFVASACERKAAYLSAQSKKETCRTVGDIDNDSKLVVGNDAAPQMLNEKETRGLHRATNFEEIETLEQTCTITTSISAEKFPRTDRGHAQFRLQEMKAKTNKIGCRYIDRGEQCRWGCEKFGIVCHAFMRGQCYASSTSRCSKGYHIFLQQDLATRHLATRPEAAEAFTHSTKDQKARQSCSARLDKFVHPDRRDNVQESSSARKRPRTCAKSRRLLSSPSCEIVQIEKDSIERQENKNLENKRKLQNAEDGWRPIKKRRSTHTLDNPATPKAGSSADRTLLDLLLEDSTNAWKVESDFMKVARGLLLSAQRGQDFKIRSAAHQCLGSLITKQITKLPIRFTDRIEWGQSNGLLTRAQAEHLRTLRHKECLH